MNRIVSLGVIVALILIHESGHMIAGYILGIPKNKMKIGFINREKKKNFIHAIVFSVTPHVALLDHENQKIIPSSNSNQMGKYVGILEYYIPSEEKMFWFVAGGHTFEFIILIILAMISIVSSINVFQIIAFQGARMALILTTIYLITELFCYIKSKKLTGGDFTGQWEISPKRTLMFYLIYYAGLFPVLLWIKQ